MKDRQQELAGFLQSWTDQNIIGSFGDHMDPSDAEHIHRRRAERLKNCADTAGFSSEITTFSRREGGLVGYVRGLQDNVEFRHKHGDI